MVASQGRPHLKHARSRSPSSSSSHRYRGREDHKDVTEKRSHHHHHQHRQGNSTGEEKRLTSVLPAQPLILPFRAIRLTKYDLDAYRHLFASYLDIQKQLIMEDLTEEEVRGRWKSFIGKWLNEADFVRNRGELAEGWYDPIMREKATAAAAEMREETPTRGLQTAPSQQDETTGSSVDDDEDAYGPALPQQGRLSRPSGPSAPNFQELAHRGELASEDFSAERSMHKEMRRNERREQRERLDELAPRAEPGTKERQLEKKRENAAVARTFRDAKGGPGEIEEVRDTELLGDAGGLDEVKKMRREMDRKKNEREVRREEILRARAVEREERLQVHREKEEKTMEMLKSIAKERFG